MGKVKGHRAAQRAGAPKPKVAAAQPHRFRALTPDLTEVPLPGCLGFVTDLGPAAISASLTNDVLVLNAAIGYRVVIRATERSVIIRLEDMPNG